MFTLFETPAWFAGFDLALDTIAFLITLIISAYSYKLYKLCKNNKFGYFGFAFALMSLAFLVKIVTYTVVYFSTPQIVAGEIVSVVTGLQSVDITFRDLLYRLGFFIQMAANLGALLLLYLVSQKSRDRLKKFYELSQIALFTYFVFLISVVSTFKYTVFYLTSLVLLALIVLNYYQNYLISRSQNSKNVLTAFIFLLIAQVFFVFIFAANWFYFVAEIFTIISFAIIAYVYVKVTRRRKKKLGKKKCPAGGQI